MSRIEFGVRVMRRTVFFWSLILLHSQAYSIPCSKERRVQFTDVQGGPGFYLLRDYGESGFSAYLYARKFAQEESEAGEFRGFFFLDDIAYQHLMVDRNKYSDKKEIQGEAEELEMHYKWEREHLLSLVKEKAAPVLGGESSYGVVESDTFTGVKRKFWIWEATLSDAKQFWVTTVVPSGIVVFSAIGVKPAEEEHARDVIENYMYRFEMCTESEQK
jgi:hypothetical protein